MNYRQAKIVLRTSIFLIVLGAAFGLYTCIRSDNADLLPESESTPSTTSSANTSPKKKTRITPIYSYAKQFDDLNDVHLEYANKVGITPIEKTKDILTLTRPIVEVKTCKDYYISPLSHSYPFLVEPAALLLHDIGAEFNRKVEKEGGAGYKLNVTSLLRTSESVGRLKKGNVNSTENSAHLYGTTFDISYVKFREDTMNLKRLSEIDLKNILAEVVLEMKEKGRCKVKYERKQGCFHITSTGK